MDTAVATAFDALAELWGDLCADRVRTYVSFQEAIDAADAAGATQPAARLLETDADAAVPRSFDVLLGVRLPGDAPGPTAVDLSRAVRAPGPGTPPLGNAV